MRRLLLMTIDFPPKTGGVARYLDALATYFRDEMIVVAPPMVGAKEADAVAGYRVFRRSLLSFKIWPRWIDAVRTLIEMKGEYDTVMTSHVLPIGLAACIAKIFTGKPYVVIVHGLDVALAKKNVWKYWMATLCLRNAKFVITNSYALKEEIGKDYGVRKAVVVYPTTTLFEDVPLDRSTKKEPKAKIRLLTVGRLVERKGHVRVLEALALLREQNHLDGIEYVIVGDGPMQKTLEHRISELGLASVVSLRHQVDDAQLQKAYKSSDVFVMPTMILDELDREGFGIVYLEAAQFGIPSIASDLPGPDEAVLHGQTGFLVKDGDIALLAKVIHRFATDKELREQTGNAARARVEKEFRPEYQFKKLEALL